jgi:hypothetical protein
MSSRDESLLLPVSPGRNQKEMVRPGRFELPTSCFGEHWNVLTRSQNFGLYYIRQSDTAIKN